MNRKDAEPLIEVFGDHTVMCLYSKHWLLRQQAIKDITQSVLDNSNEVPIKDLFSNSCKVLKRGLSDKVSQIFLSSCQFLQVLLKTLAMKLKPEDVKLQLDPIVGAMMEKLSSSNVRERDGGMQVLTFLAFDSHVHPSLVPSNLLQPLKKKEKDSPLPLKTRAKILLKCVINYGLEDSFALSLGSLTKFIVPHLLHRDAGVRDGMVNLLAGISSIIGVQKLMPHLKDVRPQTMETLQQKLDDVSNGATVFLKPVQPSLDQPYVSENDPTHTVNGVAVSSASAGVSAPQPTAAPVQAARPKQQQHHASPPPAKQQAKQAGGGGGGGGHQAHGKNTKQQQAAQQQHHQAPPIAEEEQSTDLTGSVEALNKGEAVRFSCPCSIVLTFYFVLCFVRQEMSILRHGGSDVHRGEAGLALLGRLRVSHLMQVVRAGDRDPDAERALAPGVRSAGNLQGMPDLLRADPRVELFGAYRTKRLPSAGSWHEPMRTLPYRCREVG